MGDGLWFLEGLSDGDWPEDFDHENGTYTCKCCKCGETLMGHKRRVVCKTCHNEEQD